MTKVMTVALALVLGLVLFTPVRGVDAAAAPSANEENQRYIALAPSFVTNYDGGARLRYLKTDVSLEVRGRGLELVNRHMPSIRNALILLLSSQLEEDLSSTQDKELLRQRSLEAIRATIDDLEGGQLGTSSIVNLYFTTFIIQK